MSYTTYVYIYICIFRFLDRQRREGRQTVLCMLLHIFVYCIVILAQSTVSYESDFCSQRISSQWKKEDDTKLSCWVVRRMRFLYGKKCNEVIPKFEMHWVTSHPIVDKAVLMPVHVKRVVFWMSTLWSFLVSRKRSNDQHRNSQRLLDPNS